MTAILPGKNSGTVEQEAGLDGLDVLEKTKFLTLADFELRIVQLVK
jgi:hypothetical protein